MPDPNLIQSRALPTEGGVGVEPTGMQRIADFMKGVFNTMMPNGVLNVRPGKTTQIEDAQSMYPNALLPCIDVRFALKWTNNGVASRLELPTTYTASLNIFNVGTNDPGAPVGVWFPLGIGDTTLQQGGNFVFRGHQFMAWAHTFSYEGISYRGGTGLSTDPIVSDRNLMDGPGSYAEQMLQLASVNLGFQVKAQGDECPRFLGNLVYNGGKDQLYGGSLLSMNNPVLPFKQWERPFMIGDKDSFNKISGTFAQTVDLHVNYIGGNEPTADVYQWFRIRVCGARKCGDFVPGCNT